MWRNLITSIITICLGITMIYDMRSGYGYTFTTKKQDRGHLFATFIVDTDYKSVLYYNNFGEQQVIGLDEFHEALSILRREYNMDKALKSYMIPIEIWNKNQLEEKDI